MRLNNKNSRALGALVKSVDDLIALTSKLLNGDFALSVSPVTLISSAAEVATAIAGDGFTRDVVCNVVDKEGEVITGYSGSLPVAVVATTAGDGDASLESASLDFVSGTATAVITYTGTWASEDVCTFTLGSTSSIGGKAVADKTSIDTLAE